MDLPRMVAMVGTRGATNYGKDASRLLAGGLARAGVCVVSGAARGIDGVCHEAALAAGGATVAVLGCGVDVAYPPEHKDLLSRIAESGAVVSEYPPGTSPHPSNFPQRNRIISGLSSGVVVVEADKGSGAIITADYALEQGREVFAVPGNITSRKSHATNALLKDGAVPATCPEDILRHFGWGGVPRSEEASRAQVQLSILEARIVEAAYDQEATPEEIAGETGIALSQVNSHLTMLVLRGIMKQSAGRLFSVRHTL